MTVNNNLKSLNTIPRYICSDLEGFYSEWAYGPFKKISIGHSEFQWAMLSYEWAIVNEINFQHNNA